MAMFARTASLVAARMLAWFSMPCRVRPPREVEQALPLIDTLKDFRDGSDGVQLRGRY